MLRRSLLAAIAALFATGCFVTAAAPDIPYPKLTRLARPVQHPKGGNIEMQLNEVRRFIHVAEAWAAFDVKGAGMTAALFDTGLYAAHKDFAAAGKVPLQLNFTKDNQGDPANALDGNGHGTNVAGIVAANGPNVGIAPEASIVAIKVIPDNDGGSTAQVLKALRWLTSDQAKPLNISVVNLSLGALGRPYTNDKGFAGDPIWDVIRDLRSRGVAVTVAAGNYFKKYKSTQGMIYPAILRDTVSVGAVYDADGGPLEKYTDGSKVFRRTGGQIASFTHRLHESVDADCRTDIFAPGAPVTSTGLGNPDTAESVQQGTSQAAPVTAGVILLMQQLYQRKFPAQLPKVADIERWLRAGAVQEFDGDNETDNVTHSNKTYLRIDALGALRALAKEHGIAEKSSGGAVYSKQR